MRSGKAFFGSGINDYWFEPKRYGYGAGLPIAWQGWVLLAFYVLVISAAGLLIPGTLIGYLALVVVATAILLKVTAAKTRGGWRWRRGEKD